MRWKSDRSDKTSIIPSKIYTADGVLSVIKNYSMDINGIKFDGFKGFDRPIKLKGLENFYIRFPEIKNFYYRSVSGICSMRTPENEFRNFIYLIWFKRYGDNYVGDDFVSWDDFYKDKFSNIWK